MKGIKGAGLKILRIVLSTMDIVEDEGTETAEIRKNGLFYYIKIGKDFKRKFLKTKEDEYFILFHEYLHAFLSHFYIGKYYEEIEKEGRSFLNFVFDSIVNYFIAKHLLLKEPPFLKKLYKNLPHSLYVLLNPYEVIKKGKLKSDLTSHLKNKKVLMANKVAFWIRSFLYQGNEDVHNYIEFIKSYLKNNFKEVYKSIIFIDELREFIEKIPDFLKKFFKEKRAGYSESEEMDRLKVKDGKEFKEETITTFKIAIKKVLTQGKGYIEDFKIEKIRTVVPFPGRREIAFIKRGVYPFFFKRSLRQFLKNNKKPRIYIDVSGSVFEHLPFVYGICYFLKDCAGGTVYLFSNKVYEVKLEELKEGKVRTTYGTDFDCVAKHIVSMGFKKALLITDGIADLNKNLEQKLLKNRVELYVILTEKSNFNHRTPLHNIAKKIWEVSFY